MCSFAVKNEVVEFALCLVTLVLAASAEVLLPSCRGAGLPWLLAAVLALAPRMTLPVALTAALAAGALEDALSMLPPLTATGFFALAALGARLDYLPRPLLLAAFPVFTFWTGLCSSAPVGDLFARTLLAVPLGAIAGAAAYLLGGWAVR